MHNTSFQTQIADLEQSLNSSKVQIESMDKAARQLTLSNTAKEAEIQDLHTRLEEMETSLQSVKKQLKEAASAAAASSSSTAAAGEMEISKDDLDSDDPKVQVYNVSATLTVTVHASL
tara:strand:+ start:472 stop:825 length:354 start_codon:yes stop_codon:yes gene_type:complete